MQNFYKSIISTTKTWIIRFVQKICDHLRDKKNVFKWKWKKKKYWKILHASNSIQIEILRKKNILFSWSNNFWNDICIRNILLSWYDWFGFFVWWHIGLCRVFNAKAILLEELQWHNLTHSSEDKGVHTFPKDVNLVWFGLVSLFDGISVFVGYLMPKPFS